MKPLKLIVALLLTASPAASAPPVLSAGTCTYLTGTPPGGTGATSDEPFDGWSVDDQCGAMRVVGTRAFGDDSAQVSLEVDHSTGYNACLARSWVGHSFSIAGADEALRARVDISGRIVGTWGPSATGVSTRDPVVVQVSLAVTEMDVARGTYETVGRSTLFRREAGDLVFEIDEPFDETMDVSLHAGRTYRVAMELTAQVPGTGAFVDLGPPGTGRGARIDSIEVCIDAPPDDSALRARLDALEIADLEAKLYRKECMPGVWMPLAQGGKLETARQLVADRLAQATATADPNVNARVATMRLQSADEDITAGQYQRACRDLADGLRALTTP